jgi:transcription antitermination protein NusB
MKARSVARELALLLLFQLEKKGEKLHWEKTSFQEMLVSSVRTLCELAREQIESVVQEIATFHESLVEYEISHPDNETIPLELETLPVPIPTTHEMREKLGTLLVGVENLGEALNLSEINALSQREDVQNYCGMLVKNVINHQANIDARIDEAAKDWRLERLQKMDLMLLRLAVSELLYSEDVEAGTVIDETLELAKRFTTEESAKFIHGILGAISQPATEASPHV